jgi:hypothetical protein
VTTTEPFPPASLPALLDYQIATKEAEQATAAIQRASQQRSQAIHAMRLAGASWDQIAKATGLTRQRLWQLTKP